MFVYVPEKTFRPILHVLRVGPHEANHLGLDNAFALFQYVSVFCHGTTTAYFLFMWVLVYIYLHRIHNSSLFDELGLVAPRLPPADPETAVAIPPLEVST